LVWDSAIAGGWYRLAGESHQNIFPEKLGHYHVWRDDKTDWTGLFYSEEREWRALLLENPPNGSEVDNREAVRKSPDPVLNPPRSSQMASPQFSECIEKALPLVQQ